MLDTLPWNASLNPESVRSCNRTLCSNVPRRRQHFLKFWAGTRVCWGRLSFCLQYFSLGCQINKHLEEVKYHKERTEASAKKKGLFCLQVEKLRPIYRDTIQEDR